MDDKFDTHLTHVWKTFSTTTSSKVQFMIVLLIYFLGCSLPTEGNQSLALFNLLLRRKGLTLKESMN